MARSRPLRLAAAVALLALLAAPALPGPAGGVAVAHAGLVTSSPGAGVVVPTSPAEIRLVFSEPLEAQVTSVDLVLADGTEVLSRAGEVDSADRFALVVEDPALDDGVYTVVWRTLSAADGHTAEGFFSFGVGEVEGGMAGAGTGGMTHQETDPLRMAGRWLTYAGLLLALGVAVLHRVVIRDGPMPRPLVLVLAGGLAISAAATLIAAVGAGLETGAAIDYLLGSRNGTLQLARSFVAALGAGLMLVIAGRVAGAVAAIAGLAGIVLLVAAGHSSALPGPVPVATQVVHVAAAAVWLGGIAGLLALLVRPSVLTGRDEPPTMRALVPRFSALALASIGFIGLTGVYAAWVQTGTLVPTETEYGRTLLVKSALAAGAIGLGALSYLDGGRMLGWLGGMRTRLTVEVGLAVLVLVATAALSITPPEEEPRGVAIEPIPDAFGETAPGMSMEVLPGRPGINRVVVSTTDALAASTSLELTLDQLDAGSTTRVPLTLEGMAGLDHGGMAGMDHSTPDGTADWIADAVTLGPGSEWDTSVHILSLTTGDELSRQRFAFTLDDDGIAEGAAGGAIDLPLGIAGLLVLGGALGLGLGLGGMPLPRCDPWASRYALVGGGVLGIVLGGAMAASRLVG